MYHAYRQARGSQGAMQPDPIMGLIPDIRSRGWDCHESHRHSAKTVCQIQARHGDRNSLRWNTGTDANIQQAATDLSSCRNQAQSDHKAISKVGCSLGHKVQFQARCLPPRLRRWGGQNQRAHRLGYAPNIRFCYHRDNMRRMPCFQRELFRRLRRLVNPDRRGFGCVDHAVNVRLAGVLRCTACL